MPGQSRSSVVLGDLKLQACVNHLKPCFQERVCNHADPGALGEAGPATLGLACGTQWLFVIEKTALERIQCKPEFCLKIFVL